jgi:hypothetical protein
LKAFVENIYQKGWKKRRITVTRKPKPQPRDTSLKRCLLIVILADSCNEYNNSDVIKSIIAVTASHKLMSDNDKGKFICITLAPSYTTLVWLIHL